MASKKEILLPVIIQKRSLLAISYYNITLHYITHSIHHLNCDAFLLCMRRCQLPTPLQKPNLH